MKSSLIAAHLDSWGLGQGAIDDGAGRRHRHRRGAPHPRSAAPSAPHHPHLCSPDAEEIGVLRRRRPTGARTPASITSSSGLRATSAPAASGGSAHAASPRPPRRTRGRHASARSRRWACRPGPNDGRRRRRCRRDCARRSARPSSICAQDGTDLFRSPPHGRRHALRRRFRSWLSSSCSHFLSA